MISLIPRPQISQFWSYASPLIAIVLTLVTSTLVFLAMDRNPIDALYTYFIMPISDSYGITELFVKAVPILLCAYGLALCYRASVWNIGAEGQLLIGSVIATIIALQFLASDSNWAMPLTLLAGIIGGAFWSGIVAFLKVQLNANETLTTIMMNYIALNLLLYGVHGPLKDPDGFNFPQSAMFADSTMMPMLLEGTRLHLGIAFALMAMAIVWVILSRMFIGFQLQVAGQDPAAAKMAGFGRGKMIWFALLVAGALAGLAGAVEVTGPIGQLVPHVSPGYGYAAIIVAFLGRLHPLGITFAGLLMALIYMGGEMAQIFLRMPNAFTGVFQGLILFYLLASDVLIRYQIRFTKPHWLARA